MVDNHAERAAHKLEVCPACHGDMPLADDTYSARSAATFGKTRFSRALSTEMTGPISSFANASIALQCETPVLICLSTDECQLRA